MLVDIGVGVGFGSGPFARRYPENEVIGYDILEDMVTLLRDAVKGEELGNLEVAHMDPSMQPLVDAIAGIITMAQAHHKVGETAPSLAACKPS
jgi:trans-aconitate methyltransferase